MNCPKCGSAEKFTGQSSAGNYYSCEKCGNSRFEPKTEPEPTPQEMWYWIAQHYSVSFLHRDGQNDYLEIAYGFWNAIFEENGFEACVSAAYNEAKKQEIAEKAKEKQNGQR